MNTIKMEIDENDFCFDNTCLICLQSVTNFNKAAQTNSLNFLLNYLKIKDKIKLIVCKDCGERLAQFIKLASILEKARLEMDYLLDFIQSTILNSNQSLKPILTEYSRARNLIIRRCGEQLKCPKAEVILEKIETSNYIKGIPPTLDSNSNGTNYIDTNEVPSTPVIEDIKNIKTEIESDNYSKKKSQSLKKKRNRKKAKCPNSSKIFATKHVLKLHIDTVHFHIKPYKCDMCEKAFTAPKDLRRHLASPHNSKPEIKNFETIHCEKCAKDFSSKEAFDKHLQNVHSNKEFSCRLCNKVFKRRYHLERHFSAVHDKQRHYCQVSRCDKSYSNPSHLVDHYKLDHPGFKVAQKPLESFYSDTFTVINNDGISMIECVLCRSHFKHADSVKRHLKYFHGCAQFKCQHCGYGTLIKEKLDSHIEQKHKTRRMNTEKNEGKIVLKIESKALNCF